MFDMSNYLSLHFQLQKRDIVACQLEVSKRVQERVNGSLTFFRWRSCISKFVTELSFLVVLANQGMNSKGFSNGGILVASTDCAELTWVIKQRWKYIQKMKTHTQGCSNHICVNIIGNWWNQIMDWKYRINGHPFFDGHPFRGAVMVFRNLSNKFCFCFFYYLLSIFNQITLYKDEKTVLRSENF